MKKLYRFLPFIALIFAITFNLWFLRSELTIKSDPNDNIFQFAMVNRANIIWQEYGCPWRLSCWSRLFDHWTPEWAEGYPLPFYYSHIPQIAIVASHHFFHLVIGLLGFSLDLFSYYHFVIYLILSFFPLPVFLAIRIMGFSPLVQIFGALFASHLSTDGLYGMDNSSYLWRGYGLSSQLFATFFIPLAVAYAFRTMRESSADFKSPTPNFNQHQNTTKQNSKQKSLSSGRRRLRSLDFKNWNLFRNLKLEIRNSIKTVIALTATLTSHLGLGYITLLSLVPLIFMDFKLKNVIKRTKRLVIITGITLTLLSYWIVPFWLNRTFHNISFWDPLWKFNSFGYFDVLRRFFEGELADFGRFPVLTILTVVGFFVLLFGENKRNRTYRTNKTNREKHTNKRRSALKRKRQPTFPCNTVSGNYRAATNIYLQSGATSERVLLRSYQSIALLLPFWLFLFFGRTTWGPLMKLLPGAESFHLQRFINGLHLSVLFLAPVGAAWIVQKVLTRLSNLRRFIQDDTVLKIFQFLIFNFALLIFVIPTYRQTISYAQPNSEWLKSANQRFDAEWPDFNKLITTLHQLPPGRIYAGKPGYWGKDFKIGDTQVYMALSVRGFEVSQFLPETWSPNSDTEQFFDERIKHHYDLYNLRYVVAPENIQLPNFVNLKKRFGKYLLYEVNTSGYFTIGRSNLTVLADRTNYRNLVHLWQISPLVESKLFPILSFNKGAGATPSRWPNGLLEGVAVGQNTITMIDSNTYRSVNREEKSLFAQPPLFVPISYATPTATFSQETVTAGQRYTTQVSIPSDCHNCFIVFKTTYHPNWQISVDGQQTEKMITFPFFVGIPITPGNHTIVARYRPSSLKLLLLGLSVGGIAVWFGIKKLLL